SLDPTLVTARYNLAEAYGSSPRGGSAKQIDQLRKLISMAPDFARAHLALGKALLHDGRSSEAVSELEEATHLDATSGEAHYQLGLALARTGKQPGATAELQKGRELSSAEEQNQNAALDMSEGHVALEKGELGKAEAKFRHAIRLEPKSATAERFLGVVLEKKADRQGALEAYQKAVDLSPGDSTSRRSLERLTGSTNPTPLASIEREGDDRTKISELEGYFRESRFQEVEPLLADYVKQHPSSSWGWYALGYSQFAQKKIGPSIQSLAESLRLNVKNADAHKMLGRDLMIVGRFDAAQTEFEQGIQYAPNSAENYYDLGKLFSLEDNWEEARKRLEQAVRIQPNYLEAIEALGFAQEALGDDNGALRNYEKAIALNDQQHGKFVSAHVSLSAYYERKSDPGKALEYAEKAIQLDSKCAPAWFQKGRAQERQGQLDAAVDSLNRAISLNPRSATYYYVLAGVYRRLGKIPESKQALDSFSRLDQESNQFEKMRRNMSRSREAPHAEGERE
ncbi:MAG: tetratricopeptide repeat protein, partial [Acidobacteria bacterium]|nr:tetratricopeptide repeat protein [Acidobacteriota bacterium]